MDTPRGRHAGRPDRAALGRLLPDQGRRELRGGGGRWFQPGGGLPLPGGLGGIDGGLFGTFVLFGAPVAVTAAAVLAYRVILFWLPLLVGSVAFLSLRHGLNRPDRPDLCVVPAAT